MKARRDGTAERRTGNMAVRKKNGKSAGAQRRAYLAALPPESRTALQGLWRAIRDAAPAAEDAFSYGIPGFRLDGRPLVWCAAWKRHVSIYPIGPELIRAHGIDIADYETSKGTIRFPLANLPSAALVKRLVKARMTQLRKVR
jgi:uncharacterized protein YdhG (YjbR/CyaY superfamily)